MRELYELGRWPGPMREDWVGWQGVGAGEGMWDDAGSSRTVAVKYCMCDRSGEKGHCKHRIRGFVGLVTFRSQLRRSSIAAIAVFEIACTWGPKACD